MWRVVVLAGFATGCGDRTCTLDDALDDLVRDATPTACGELAASGFGEPYDERAYASAHACVVSALEAQRPFLVRWQIQGIEGLGEDAYLGLAGSTGLDVSWLQRGINGDGSRMPAARSTCGALQDRAGCVDLRRDLCFRCQFPEPADACGD